MAQTGQLSESSQLSLSAMKAAKIFADSMAEMFDTPVECSVDQPAPRALRDLREKYTQPAASACIIEPEASQKYYLLFDSRSLFVLSGIFLMLPDAITNEKLASGTLKDAIENRPAMREISDFFTRVWNRVAQESGDGQLQLAQQQLNIGNIWEHEPLWNDDTVFLCIECTLAPNQLSSGKLAILLPGEELAPAKNDEEPRSTPGENAGPAPPAQPDQGQDSSKSPASDKQAGPEPAGFGVADAMTTNIVWADENDTVEHLSTRLLAAGEKYAIVGTPDDPAGIVSRCDLRAAISPYMRPSLARWRRQQDVATLDIRVKWAMTSPIRTCKTDMALRRALEAMHTYSIGALPVKDANGRICGLLTKDTILNTLLRPEVPN